MEARGTLAACDVRALMSTYRDALRAHQHEVNRLNVYPVPDGDTGTNMALTLDAVVSELDAAGGDLSMADVCKAMGHGSLMGARGNSGVILSQLLRGIAERFARLEQVGPADVAEALVVASDLADKAVVRPVEGTILTVARAAGEGATRAVTANGHHPPERLLLAVAEEAHGAAASALARTPEMLEVLARAGVVDAGGTGYLLLLDSLLAVVDGRPVPPPSDPTGPAPDVAARAGATAADGAVFGHSELHPDGHAAVGDLRYEVMYLLHAPDDTVAAFKEVWAGLGDSIVVVGGDGLYNCHIHTDDIGAAIEAALDVGTPSKIRVTDLVEQMEEERWVREHPPAPEWAADPDAPVPVTDVVAVVTGEGIGRIFRSLGVHRQVVGGQTMNPSTAQLLEAVDASPSLEVVLLPNNKNIRPVAEQVAGLTDKTVRVVPTTSIVEGFAALLAYDPAADAVANVQAMTASSERVVAGEVTRAVRSAHTDIGPVEEGDWIGMSTHGLVAKGDTVADACCRLLGRLIGEGHELVTLIEGEGSTAADTRHITEWLADSHPQVAVEIHHGGQPLYPYLVGIE